MNNLVLVSNEELDQAADHLGDWITLEVQREREVIGGGEL